jgi:hypothetical protein
MVLSVTGSGWLDEGCVESRVDEAERGRPKQPCLVVVVSFVQMQFQHELCLGTVESTGPGNEELKGNVDPSL